MMMPMRAARCAMAITLADAKIRAKMMPPPLFSFARYYFICAFDDYADALILIARYFDARSARCCAAFLR